MAIYKARESWLGNHPPMDYLKTGDKVVIRGEKLTIRIPFWKDGRLGYTTDRRLLWADELVRVK